MNKLLAACNFNQDYVYSEGEMQYVAVCNSYSSNSTGIIYKWNGKKLNTVKTGIQVFGTSTMSRPMAFSPHNSSYEAGLFLLVLSTSTNLAVYKRDLAGNYSVVQNITVGSSTNIKISGNGQRVICNNPGGGTGTFDVINLNLSTMTWSKTYSNAVIPATTKYPYYMLDLDYSGTWITVTYSSGTTIGSTSYVKLLYVPYTYSTISDYGIKTTLTSSACYGIRMAKVGNNNFPKYFIAARVYQPSFQVGFISASDGSVTQCTVPNIGTGTRGVGISLDGTYVFHATYNSGVMHVSKRTNATTYDYIRTITIPSSVIPDTNIEISDDARYLFVGTNPVYVFKRNDDDTFTRVYPFDIEPSYGNSNCITIC